MTEKPAIIDSNNSIKRIQESVSFQDAIKIAQEDQNYTEEEFVEIYKKFPERAVYSSYFEQSCGVINEAKKLLGILKNEVCDDKERILDLLPDNARLVFKLLENYKDQPWAKDVLIEAAKEDFFTAFSYFSYYKDQPWAKDILIEAAKEDSFAAFENYPNFKDQPWAKDILIEAAKENSFAAFENYPNFKDQPWAKDILIEAAKKDPFPAFEKYPNFKDQPWAKDILETAKNKDVLIEAAKEDSLVSFSYFSYYKDQPWAKDVLIEAAKKDPFPAFNSFSYYKDQPWAKDILIEAAKKDPFNAFSYFSYYKDQPWAKDVLIEAAKKDPFDTFEKYPDFKDQPRAKYILETAKNKDVIIGDVKKDPFNAFIYFSYYKDQPWAKDVLIEAAEVVKSSESVNYLQVVYCINNLHNEKDDIRYLIIDNWGSKDLYKLVYEGREEIFTSTYNGIANRLLAKLKNDGKDIYDIVLENNFEGVTVFLEVTTSYGRFNDFFENIKSSENKKILLQKLVESVKIDLVKNSVALMEIIENIQDSTILNYIGELIKENYKKGGDSKKVFGIIGRFGRKYFNDSFFDDLPIDYDLQEIKGIPSNELFDKSGRNIQQYYFYNDEDGKASFYSFISNYKKDSNWKIEDKKSFVKVTSKQRNGKQIIIFANKPEFDGETEGKDGSIDIQNEMNSLEFPLESIIIVHRGHSYHAQKTIDRIPSIAKMVFLGSCGGFQNIGETLEKSPLAHIISTKGTGTKVVNDPLFKLINDKILNGEDIIWKEIWEEISKKVGNNEDFKKYIRPDQNLGVLFLNKYNSLD